MSFALRKPGVIASFTLALLCLLASAPRPADATFPGRPGLIAFNHIPRLDDLGNYVGGLYAIRPGWEKPRRLTDNAWDDEASFAPSGRRLAFSRVLGPERGIYTLDLSSGGIERLTRGAHDRSPAFGTRGRIVFSRRSQLSKSYDLFLRTATGRLRQLTSTTSVNELNPVFTPDGSRILFAGYAADEAAFSTSGPIYSIRVDGSGLRELKGFSGVSGFDVSPDGRSLVFGKPDPEGGARSPIWTKKIDGGRPKLIAETALIPAYSPDGRKVAYSMYRELWLTSADGSGEPRLLSEQDAVGFYLEGKLTTEPAWQPLPRRR